MATPKRYQHIGSVEIFIHGEEIAPGDVFTSNEDQAQLDYFVQDGVLKELAPEAEEEPWHN